MLGSIQVIGTINDGIHTGADTVTMTIVKSTPSYTWGALSNQTYPYEVVSGILNASTSTPGSSAYSVSVGDTLPVGTNQIKWTFTPTDAANINSLVVNNPITILPGTASVNVSNRVQLFDGNIKYLNVSTTPPNLDSLTITYTGNHDSAGTYPVLIVFANHNYNTITVHDTLTISKKAAILSWPQPANVPYGTLFSSLQLDASANVPGYFIYNYSIGANIPRGTTTLTATFVPYSGNYSGGTITATISSYPVNPFCPACQYYISNKYFQKVQ